MPRVGQFNDRLEMDVVHTTAADGNSHAFLGVIDKATHYHVVRTITRPWACSRR